MTKPPNQPHDITVMPSPSGYLVGRILPPKPHGPWWEYLETIPDLAAALARARELAREHQARAWFYQGTYRQIAPIEDAPES